MRSAKDLPDLHGKFISFEGGDGAGKTTQIRRLADVLGDAGYHVIVTREPGGSKGGEHIRELLVTGSADRWSPMTEALLMYASRRDHLEKVIQPALDNLSVVLTDRFSDSTMAYQGIAGALGPDAARTLQSLVVGNQMPDLTIVLDTDANGLERADTSGGEGRFENKGSAFQSRVREAFRQIASENPERCVLVDAAGSIDDVHMRVLDAIIRHF